MAGMRPGEIFALRCADVEGARARIHQRIYRGHLGSLKTVQSNRWAAMGDGLSLWLREWLEWLPARSGEDWLFPSERHKTPIRKDNCWRRNFLPRLTPVALAWASFQALRRSHACPLDDLGIDPQVRADQMGHSVDVNQNQYTQSSLERRRSVVNALEKSLGLR